MAILEAHDLRKIYGSGDTEVRTLDNIDLAVEKGEFAAVVGTSGSGKSTLLHMLGGLDRPTGGSVTVDGRELSALKDDVMSLLTVTSRRFAQTIVMITHNEEIAQMADRIIRIEDGRIVVRG